MDRTNRYPPHLPQRTRRIQIPVVEPKDFEKDIEAELAK